MNTPDITNDFNNKETQVLVTGGTGFIGVPLCNQLQVLGYQVTVLTRNVQKAQAKLSDKVWCVSGLASLPDTDFPIVINLAGEPLAGSRWNSSAKALFRASRIETTNELFAYFQGRGSFPKLLVSGSAIGFYGDSGDKLLTEDEPSGRDYAAVLCRDWEQAAQAFTVRGTRVCLLRTGIVLGSSGGVLAKMLPAFRMAMGGNLGEGTQWMSWIHMQDLIRMIIFCINNPQVLGAINGVAPEPVTNAQFAQTLGLVMRRPTLISMPRWLLHLLFGEMAEALMLASQRVIPRAITRYGFTFDYPQLETALTEILTQTNPKK